MSDMHRVESGLGLMVLLRRWKRDEHWKREIRCTTI